MNRNCLVHVGFLSVVAAVMDAQSPRGILMTSGIGLVFLVFSGGSKQIIQRYLVSLI